MALAPDGRIFVSEQAAQLRVIKDGALLRDAVPHGDGRATGERGLLGVAFDPDFAANRYVYVYYTATTPDRAQPPQPLHRERQPTSPCRQRDVILELNIPRSATNHNGGALHFGPDGKLYVAVGENAHGDNAQTLDQPARQDARLNADGTIPADNPFFSSARAQPGDLGARPAQPLHASPSSPAPAGSSSTTSGQSAWEEINDGVGRRQLRLAGHRGPHERPALPRAAATPTGHGSAAGEAARSPAAPSTTRRAQFPAEYVGDYFFADYCAGGSGASTRRRGRSRRVRHGTRGAGGPRGRRRRQPLLPRRRTRAPSPPHPLLGAGEPPAIITPPRESDGAVGQPATFTVSATGTAPLRYQWQRERRRTSPGATAASLHAVTTAQLGDNGRAVPGRGLATPGGARATRPPSP